MTKSIIITGAAGNLGKAVVKRLIDEGYFIEATLGPHETPGYFHSERLHSQPVDLSDAASAAQFVTDVAFRHEEIAAAILLVGGFAMGGLKETTDDDLMQMYRLNFETAYNMVRPLLRQFEKQASGGQIIMIGTRPALNPAEGKSMVAYALSKSLIFRLSDLINEEYKRKNISSCVIVPATMDTPANRSSMPGADFSKWVPTGNVADVIAFILSDTGKMIKEPVIKIYNKA